MPLSLVCRFFAGYKWFRPARTAKLEMTHVDYKPVPLELQVHKLY